MTADRVSGLKIGYRRGNKLAGIYDKVMEWNGMEWNGMVQARGHLQ